jgi:hypothetical protein
VKVLSWLPLVCLAVSVGFAQPDAGSVDQRFDQVADLRSRGEFDAAIDLLTGIIQESSQSDEALRRAYNQLVWTIVVKSADVNERARQTGNAQLRDELDGLARRLGEVVGDALTRFPDLRAGDDIPDPSRVNQVYEPARQRMFGNLVVISEPDSAEVWINDDESNQTPDGWTPLRRNLFPVGDYEIRLSKEGFHDENLTTRIRPNETVEHNVPLRHKRSKTWWLTRVIVPTTAAVGLIVYALTSGDDGGTQEPQPLPFPPDPPQ